MASTTSPASAAVAKAKAASKATIKGTNSTTTRRIRTTATFRRPTTLALSRKPKYARRAVPRRADGLDAHAVIKYPLNTESAMRQVEDHNTLVLICDVRADKRHIKKAINELYGVAVSRINTLIRPTGEKKAYVRLAPEVDAMETAGKIGLV